MWNNKPCAICHQTPAQFQYPTVFIQRDVDCLYCQNHMVCNLCEKQLIIIKNHAEENDLKFGIGSLKGKNVVNCYIDFTKSNSFIQQQHDQLNISHYYKGYDAQIQPFYNDQIKNLIRKNKLYESQSLPINIRQLLYYCTINVSVSERHERVRNTMLRVMVGHALPISAIKNASILVQFLLCYLRDFEVYFIMGKLCQVISCLEQQSEGWGKIYQGVQAYKLFDCICQIIRQGMSVVSSYHNHKSIKGQFNEIQINKIQQNQPNLNFSRGRTFSNGDIISCNCMETFNKQTLKELSRMKNHCTFIMSSYLQEQQGLKEMIRQIQNKHKKEKEQYINKIIILKEKINELEKKQQIIQPENHYHKNKQQYDQSIPIESIVSNLMKDHIHIKTKNKKSNQTKIKLQRQILQHKISPSNKIINQQSSQFKKLKDQKQNINGRLALDFNISKIISETNIMQFQDSMKHLSSQNILNIIISNINLLQQEVKNLLTKSKQQETEVKRLLLILKRKEEKFIPLMHEKDQIIQMYENALWKLQNGLQMGENKLAPRIQIIRKLQYERSSAKIKQQKSGSQKKNLKKKKDKKTDISQLNQNQIKQQRKQSCQIY